MKPKPLTVASPVRIESDGLVLREWRVSDTTRMVELFDTAEMARWTPVPMPFTEDAARQYVLRAQQGRDWGLVQLAITTDDEEPIGEVQLWPTDDSLMCDYAYGVGSRYRGQRLATRAMLATFPLAVSQGYERARLRVPIDNVPSTAVARRAGFELTEEPLHDHQHGDYVLRMATWIRDIDA